MNIIHCAGVIFLTKENRVLLEDRRKIKKHGEHWSFFGGSVEEGETPEQTMKKGIAEFTLKQAMRLRITEKDRETLQDIGRSLNKR